MDCIFCKILNDDSPYYSVYEDKIVKVFLDINSSTLGHIIIIPKKHYENLNDIDLSTLTHINVVSKKMYILLKEKLNIEGMDIIQNNGDIQGIKHYHMHLKLHYTKANFFTTEQVYKKITDLKKRIINYGEASKLLNTAKEMHNIMEREKWHYSVGNDLYWYDIKNSLNNPNKATCCSTYIGVCLYKSGIFSEDEINSFNYNWAPYIYSFLVLNGWIEIDEYDNIRPGDIVFETDNDSVDHVQIYAGDGKWFNAGSTEAIQRVNPYNIDINYSKRRFFCAMRNPN